VLGEYLVDPTAKRRVVVDLEQSVTLRDLLRSISRADHLAEDLFRGRVRDDSVVHHANERREIRRAHAKRLQLDSLRLQGREDAVHDPVRRRLRVATLPGNAFEVIRESGHRRQQVDVIGA
jgi:pimeloyl-ACP methyl ester carboxylesterase